jgi:hypothetical protein
MNDQYDINKWKGLATKNLFIGDYFIDKKTSAGWYLYEKNVSTKTSDYLLTEYYLQHLINKDEAIKIDIHECASWDQAHALLSQYLQVHMAQELPRTRQQKERLGDVDYAGFGDMEQHILFTRANMLVVLNTIGHNDVSVRAMADAIDTDFYLRPLQEEGTLSAVINFSFSINKTDEENILELQLSIQDNLQRPLWYKLFAAGGEFYKRNDQLFFNSPNDQAPKISLIIKDEYGAWTQKNLS